MNTRFASAALIALSLGAFASPAFAQGARTFHARGHEFLVPGSQSAHLATSAVRGGHLLMTGSIGAPISAKLGEASRTSSVVHQPATHTIDVWGARITVPNA
jgi:hypothetical protein